jgi:hypothetical protein
MDNETKTKLFNENVGTAFAATKKIRRVYLNTEFSDANRALLDSEEWSQVVKLCAWELLDRYDPSRGKVTTFFYIALPRRVSIHINGFNQNKDKNGDYRGGIKNSYGKSKYRKGISHFSFHGRSIHHADSIFRTENTQLVNEALSVDGKFPDFGEVMDFGEVDIIEINKQVNAHRISSQPSCGDCKSNMSTAEMIEARFGIGSYKCTHQLKDIGSIAGGITRERVRQRIDDGLKRIKRAVKSHRESVKLELWMKEREAKLQLKTEEKAKQLYLVARRIELTKSLEDQRRKEADALIWVMQQYRD